MTATKATLVVSMSMLAWSCATVGVSTTTNRVITETAAYTTCLLSGMVTLSHPSAAHGRNPDVAVPLVSDPTA